ncbi:MAG: UPF0182 family protein [Clostridia bacterium]|nr:UPF0182 family protein [Clostridia bacterium]
MNRKKIALELAFVGVIALITLFVALIGFITDYLWFDELGYVSVFLKKLVTQLEIGIPGFIVITIFSYIYLKCMKRSYFKKVNSRTETNEKRLNKITWAISAVFGFILSLTLVNKLWFEILQFINSTDFSLSDPLFGLDISFYVFKLQFIKDINAMILGITIAFAIMTFVYYFILMFMRKPLIIEVAPEPGDEDNYEEEDTFEGSTINDSFAGSMNNMFGRLFKKGKNFTQNAQKTKSRFEGDGGFERLMKFASKQVITIGVVFFLMVAVNFFLRQFDLLYSNTGVLYGAGYTDVNITLWVYRALCLLSIIAALNFAIGISKKQFKKILTVPVLMIAVGALGTGAAGLIQNWVVSPDEIAKESTYLERNIEYTQAAYGLKDVNVKSFSAANTLTADDLENNQETLSNIRINDFEPAEKFYNQTQSIRQYYSFNDVDVDRYMINGDYTQTFLSAREIDETKIREEWLNKHLKYTHGYGVTLSRVDQVTDSGQPDMLIDSIPPVSQVEEIDITRPEIYFGELASNYLLVNTDEEEFDYPDGDSNTYTTYEGSAGISLNPINRLMFAIREKSIKLLVSTNVSSDSKIIINRNITQRIQEIMPYLSYDSDPYIVTADGGLYWIIDAYTVSSNYPYSEPYSKDSSVNYIRNSVKVVINAYNGETNYYLVDEGDPIAKTYKKIYPDLFKDFDQMPESLQAHIRYPNVMFNIQANVYKRYHMNDVKVFYQGEDLWDISNEIYGTEEVVMSPNYYIMKLPGESAAEFVNSIPYTPKDKKNMTGLLVARNDGEHYGELVLYQLPKSKIIYGPMQIEAQIDQNPEISKEFSLWNSSGSTYTRGNMFVIPIEESLLYVEPVYLEATNSSIPEVKRVIVAYGDRIAYESTFNAALDALFGSDLEKNKDSQQTDTNADSNTGVLTQNELIFKASEAYNNAQSAQKSGDWAGYGRYLSELEKYLNLLSNNASASEAQAAAEAE